MLIGIPDVISPDLLKILHEMGHGDEIVIGDANFPAASCANRLIRCDGHNLLTMLEAISKIFLLDIYVDYPVTMMKLVEGDTNIPEIYDDVKAVICKHDKRGEKAINYIDRFKFYERAKNAYAIVATTERKLYGCVILTKGIIR
jgi:L-fucose mutarotase